MRPRNNLYISVSMRQVSSVVYAVCQLSLPLVLMRGGPGVSGRSARSRGGNVPIVPVWRYASHGDYKSRNSIGGSYLPVNCTVADLFRYSLDNGAFEGHVVTSWWGRAFYCSIPRFALAPDRASKCFCVTDDYRHAEASYKGAVSFFMGMIGARLVFEKFLGGNKPNYQLLHAGDSKHFILTPSIGKGKSSSGNGKKSSGKPKPDYVAIDDRGVPYALVEAKGTSGARVRYASVEEAKGQLQLDLVITLDAAGRPLWVRSGDELEKHVVASSFPRGVASKACSWELCDVDPDGAGKGELIIKLDGAIYAHYMPVLQWLSRDEVRRESVSGVDCDLVQIGDGVSVGLVSGLREVIADHGNVTVGFGDQGSGVQERDSADCFHRVSEFFRSMEGFQGWSEGENVSMGGDGVVVVLSDDYVHAFGMEAERTSGVS